MLWPQRKRDPGLRAGAAGAKGACGTLVLVLAQCAGAGTVCWCWHSVLVLARCAGAGAVCWCWHSVLVLVLVLVLELALDGPHVASKSSVRIW